MEKNFVLNGNKLIAQFIDLKINDEDYNIVPKNMFNDFVTNVMKECDWDTLEFHESWDWLMPVVEKIESLKPNNWNVKCVIFGYKSLIIVSDPQKGGQWNSLITEYDEKYKNHTKLEKTYTAVIEFITWYNRNS